MKTAQTTVAWMSWALLLVALGLLTGCNETGRRWQLADGATGSAEAASTRSVRSGTTILVSLACNLSSGTARVGDAWTGTVTEFVMNQGENVIPPGSPVEGVVTGVRAAQAASRGMLELGVRRIQVDGHDESIIADGDPVVAGSSRARNLGAIVNGAVAGSRMNRTAGAGDSPEVGDIIPGPSAVRVVAASAGHQLVLADGTVMSFTVNQTVAMR